MINVFRNDNSDIDWLPELLQGIDYQTTTNLDTPKNLTVSFITCLDLDNDSSTYSHSYKTPVPYTVWDDKITEIERYAAKSCAVFIIETGIYLCVSRTVHATAHLTNVFWLIPGRVKDAEQTAFLGWHSENTVKVYNYHALSLDPYGVKPRYFDALLGTSKLHRDFVYRHINEIGAEDSVIMTYYGNNTGAESLVGHKGFIWNPDGRAHPNEQEPTLSTENVEYFGHNVRLSQIIVEEVYNTTAYSIITESYYFNDFSFVTEKTAKAILGCRLFVMFSGMGFLRDLRQLGFQTFDGIIDESYDLVEHDDTRFAMAMQQVKRLLALPQAPILELARPICEHNFALLTSGQIHNAMLDFVRSKM